VLPIQVDTALARLLPDAMLAALQLTYLGGLPAAVQQQLSTRWAGLLAHAAVPEYKHSAATAAGVGAAAGAGAGAVAVTAGSTAAAAAGLPQKPAVGVPSQRETGGKQQGGCPSGSTAANWDSLLSLGGGQHAVPASVLMREAALLQHRGVLAQQLQLAVAAIDLVGRPVLVVDPLGLLLSVLELQTERGSATMTADSSSSKEATASKRSSSTSSNGGPQWVVVRCERGADVDGAAAAAAAAFAGGRDVCLRLHNVATQQQEPLVAEVIAAWHGAQLLQHNSSGPNGNQCGHTPLSSSSIKGCRSSKAAARPSARLAPRLLVHVDSPCAVLPVSVAGLLGVVGIGAECILQPTATPSQLQGAAGPSQLQACSAAGTPHVSIVGCGCRQGKLTSSQRPCSTAKEGSSHGDGSTTTVLPADRQERGVQYGWVYEAMQRVVLPLVGQRGCRAALSAQQAAEETREDTERTESLLLKHAAQVSNGA
jgi:hypothetical protein